MDDTKTTETPSAPPASTDLNPFRIEVKRKESTQPKPGGFDMTPSTTPTAPALDTTPSPATVPEPDLAVPATPEKEVASTNLADALKAESTSAPASDAFDAAMQSATTSTTPVKKKGKGMAITAVVLVVVAVLAGSAYAYMQTRPVKTKDTPAPAVSAAVKPAAITPADVDKSTTDIDDSLKKIDDTKDFATTDLSDTTVGL